MAQLHAFTGQLPEDRTQLYTEAVQLLLERWANPTGAGAGIVEHLAIPTLKMSDLRAGLYAVAFKAHSRHSGDGDTADIAEGELRAWLAPFLNNDWNKAGVFIDYIRERAGLLIRHKTEAYTFPHRTFQEFLAACHLASLPDYASEAARLVRAEPDRWREVFCWQPAILLASICWVRRSTPSTRSSPSNRTRRGRQRRVVVSGVVEIQPARHLVQHLPGEAALRRRRAEGVAALAPRLVANLRQPAAGLVDRFLCHEFH